MIGTCCFKFPTQTHSNPEFPIKICSNSYLITDPWKLIVTLKGDPKYHQAGRAGIYVLGPNAVNERSHWLQDPGPNAIWYNNGSWKIGDQRILGGTLAGLKSYDGLGGPQEATSWKYANDVKWITSDDILVDTFELGKYFRVATVDFWHLISQCIFTKLGISRPALK